MVNWLTSLEAVKQATDIKGSTLDAIFGRHIREVSEEIEGRLRKWLIPRTETRYFPASAKGNGYVLDLTQGRDNAPPDLLAVTSLTTANGTVTLDSSDYFLEPINDPPYDRIEIDLGDNVATDAVLTYDDSPQRAHAVTGRWGWSEDTETAGALAEALDASETEINVTNASLVDVGNTLLCETEQMFVSGRSPLTTTTTLNGALATGSEVVTVAVADGTKVKQGEIILVDSEKMIVDSISANNLTVRRAHDGSVLAAHNTGTTVYAYRTLTVVRGVNGTTAATHADTTALSKYIIPGVVEGLCRAQAIFNYQQDKAGHTGTQGQGEGTTRVTTFELDAKWKKAKAIFRIPVTA